VAENTRTPRAREARRIAAVALALFIGAAPHFTRDVHGEEGPRYRRTVVRYATPDVVLRNQYGVSVRLVEELRPKNRPVLLNFVFATCTTVCPVLSAGFAGFQKQLGERASEVRLISITTDPDHDTPDVLREYREQFGAAPSWEFLTGSRDDIDRVLQAFDVASPSKQAHRPVNLLRRRGETSWIRLDGLVGGAELAAEYRGSASTGSAP
jgi:protein SCO1